MALVPTNGSKEIMKKYEELWNKIREFIRSITKKKYMKIQFNLDDDLTLNKTLELRYMIIVVRAVFHGDNKYYSQVFLVECLYKL